MMPVTLLLWHAAILLGVGGIAVFIRQQRMARWFTYGATLSSCATALGVALDCLVVNP